MLPTDVEAMLAHMLDHITIADIGARKGHVMALQIFFEAHVRHDRRDNAAAPEIPAFLPGAGDQRHQLVAVDQPPVFIADQQPVRIAVKRDTEMCALLHDAGAHGLCRGRAAAVIDIEAVGGNPHGNHVRLQLPQNRRSHFVGRAMGAIDHNLEPFQELMSRETALGKLDIAALRVIKPLGPAQKLWFRKNDITVINQVRLDAFLHIIGEFIAIRAEQLDAVILERVMGGGDHNPDIRAQRPGQHGNCRGW